MMKNIVLASALIAAMVQPAFAEVPNADPSGTSGATESASNVSGAAVDDDRGAASGSNVADDRSGASDAHEAPNVGSTAARSKPGSQVASMKSGDTTCRVLPQRTARKKASC